MLNSTTKLISYLLIYGALIFCVLWRGSDVLWRQTVLQILIFASFFSYAANRFFSGKRLFDSTSINRPMLALCLLILLTAFFAQNKGLAFNAVIQCLSCVAGFYIFMDMSKHRDEQRRLVAAMTIITMGLCIYGLLIHFKIFIFPSWELIGAYQKQNLCATFINHCHMAGWLEMAILVFIGVFFIRDWSLLWIMILLLILTILATSLILTLARGGWMAAVSGFLFMIWVAFSYKSFRMPKQWLIYGGSAVLVIALLIFGSTSVTKRSLTVIEQKSNALAGRQFAFAGTIDMIKANPLAGVGPGNFATAFTRFQPPGFGGRFYFTHNDYLQFTAETGIIFIPVMLWLIVSFFKTGFKKLKHPSRQIRWITLGAMGGIVTILIHSFGDFNLQIPSNAFLFTLLAAQVAAPAPQLKKNKIQRLNHD